MPRRLPPRSSQDRSSKLAISARCYQRDRQELTVLDGIDLEVPDGAFEA